MQFNQRRLNVQFYCDDLEANTKSLDGNIGTWLYTTGSFIAVYLVVSRKEAGDTWRRFADDVGIPNRLMNDLTL